jgi:hypothetical protein
MLILASALPWRPERSRFMPDPDEPTEQTVEELEKFENDERAAEKENYEDDDEMFPQI